jgi:hypothetical protein
MIVVLAFAGGLAQSPAARGQEFRIETKIYSGEKAEAPQSESLTLYAQGVVYDFLLPSPGEIAVFKPSAGEKPGRFILIDPARGIRTELSTDEILTYLTEMQRIAAEQKDPLLRFAADPKFDETYNTSTQILTLVSDVMRYELKTQPAKDEGLTPYREFCDWYARLGAMTHVRSLPPMARLAVNAALFNHKVTASEVKLTIPPRRGFQADPLTLRAEHRIDWRLSKDDAKRIDGANELLIKLTLVSSNEYLAERFALLQ